MRKSEGTCLLPQTPTRPNPAGARPPWRTSRPTDPAPAVPRGRLAGPWLELASSGGARGRPAPRPLWREIAETGPAGDRGRFDRPRACPGLRSPCRAPPWPISPALLELLADPSRTRPGRRSPSRALPEIVAGGHQAGRCRISWL
jgi:hypothetical protein